MRCLMFIKRIILEFSKVVFYIYASLWLIKPRRVKSIEDIYRLFYIDFLKLDPKDVEIVEMNRYRLVTRCRNKCPILALAQNLGLDTRYVCRIVSEPVCRYVLRRLDSKIVFNRNYSYIRPYKDGCEEHIYRIELDNHL